MLGETGQFSINALTSLQIVKKNLIGKVLVFLKNRIIWLMASIMLISIGYFSAVSSAVTWDTYSDTWVATDDLGRTLPGYSQVGAPRQDKFVGMFYFLWLGQHGTGGPYDITNIIANNTDAMNNPNSPPWGALGEFHHWGESQFGYYLSNDTYVFRKHAQMLADAGVDTLIFDVTNGYTYKDNYMALLAEYTVIRANGGKTPQIVFLCPFGDPTAVVQQLYTDLYGAGLYSDLWFRWDNNKPLIMADPAYFSGNPTLLNFFSFRKPQPDYFSGPTGANQWGWLEVYPQHSFSNNEQVVVGVGQNAVNGALGSMSQPGARGRSFSNGSQPAAPYTTNYGNNFAEQWDRAIQLDPKFVFVTGWNEWAAQRFNSFAGYTAPNIFVDLFSQEFSRDIEPMKGGYGDNYYYQLVNYIRKYKGVSAPQSIGGQATITIDGNFSDWSGITQEFRDDIGDTSSRNSLGWGSAGTYTNTTGRNDFEVTKVARDANNIYFYAKTKLNITNYTDANWMRLFIKTNNTSLNWKGYNFVVNRIGITSATTTLEQVTGANGWNWSTVSSSISYRITGREIELVIPRTSLGLSNTLIPLEIDFKWHDNMQVQGDSAEFTNNGDSAPNERYNYRFTEIVPIVQTATASSDIGGQWLPSNVIDRNAATNWSSIGHGGTAVATEWIYVDKGAVQTVAGVSLTPRAAGLGFPVDFKFQYSSDALTWTDVPGQSYIAYANPGSTVKHFNFSSSLSTRYIRLYITKLGVDNLNNHYAQLAELTVNATRIPGIYEWNFNTASYMEGWTLVNQLSGTVSGGSLNLTSSGTDPYLHSPNNLGIWNPATNNKVRIRMKNNTSDTSGQIFFITNSDGVWSQSKSKVFTTIANSNYTNYVIDMGTVGTWTGTIKQIRLDPLGATGTVNVDYIRITD